jgi:CMP-N,N'-diacetyllegionaminic acid synthase
VIYCIDIDGTICATIGTDYAGAQPIERRIAYVNRLFDEGHEIIFFTARGSLHGIDHEELTKSQLASWGVKYNRLQMGKPAADAYVDDRAITDIHFFQE